MPFFSIIIPVYNVAPYIRECLDSVLAQTFTDWEAICVDDGSTDGSGAILDEYAAKDKRFRVIHQKNVGVSAARNSGLNIGKGKYILFLDSDDYFEFDLLSHLIEVVNNYDLIVFGMRCLDEKGVLTSNFEHWDVDEVVQGDAILRAKPTSRLSPTTWTACGKCLRSEILKKFSLKFVPDIKLGEDMLFMCEYMSLVDLVFIDSKCPCYIYRRYSGCTAKRFTLEMMRNQLDWLENLSMFNAKHPSSGLRNQIYERAKSLLRLGKHADITETLADRNFRECCVEMMLGDERMLRLVCVCLLHSPEFKYKLFALIYIMMPQAIRRSLLLHI